VLPYSPDLALNDFHIFLHLKKWLDSQRFKKNKQLKAAMLNWLNSQAADFYAKGIKKLVPRCLEKMAITYTEK